MAGLDYWRAAPHAKRRAKMTKQLSAHDMSDKRNRESNYSVGGRPNKTLPWGMSERRPHRKNGVPSDPKPACLARGDDLCARVDAFLRGDTA